MFTRNQEKFFAVGGVFVLASAFLILATEWKIIPQQKHEWRCLADDEITEYEKGSQERTGPMIIKIRHKETRDLLREFSIEDVHLTNAYAIELHPCGIYTIKLFNFEANITKDQPDDFRVELWRYDYSGHGIKYITIADSGADGNDRIFYSAAFTVDPQEKYLLLLSGMPGKADHSLILNDLETKKDSYKLNLGEIINHSSTVIPGSIGIGRWINNGEYLWTDVFVGARSYAYIKIKRDTWETEIFPAPEMLAGVERASNPAGYLAYVDIPTFTGFQEVYEQILEEAKQEGKKKNLFVANLRTGEVTLVDSIEPEFIYHLEWISDTELRYKLPDGTEKIYTVD